MTSVATDPHSASFPLVGRDRELKILRARLAATLEGQGSLVLIGGEAGIGKTTLAETICAEATAQGLLVLIGRSYDLTATPPYGPWVEALERLHERPDLPNELRVSPQPAAAASTSQPVLFVRVRALLAGVTASRPVVLLLDDLHWADPASFDLLRFLGRAVAGLPLLLLVSYRADELPPDHALYQLLPRLAREALAWQIDLHPLTTLELGTLIQQRYALPPGGRARLIAYLHAYSEGNPLYVAELLQTLESTGLLQPAGPGWALGDLSQVRVPPLLRQIIAGRVARLDPDTQRLLSLAAVIGQEVPLDLWGTLGASPEEALLCVVERAVAARLIEAGDEGRVVRFTHTLIREVIYEGLLPPRRRAWHRQIGEWLAARHPPDPETAADHFRRAGDRRAVAWLIAAGERAQQTYAWSTASERYSAALALSVETGANLTPGEEGWLRARVALLRRYTDLAQALRELERATQLAVVAGDETLLAHTRFSHGLILCFDGQIERGLAEIAASVAAFDALTPEERARLGALENIGVAPGVRNHRSTLVLWQAISGRYVDAFTLYGELPAWAPSGEPDPVADADIGHGLALVHTALGRPAAARVTFARARWHYRALDYHFHTGWLSLQELCWLALLYGADRGAELDALVEEAEAAWASASSIHPDLPAGLARLPLLLLRGDWNEASEIGAELSDTAWSALRMLFVATVLGPLARWQGDHARAWRFVHAELPDGPATVPGNHRFLPTVALLRLGAALALDAHDLQDAQKWLATHDRWLAWSASVLGQAEAHLLWAAYYRAAGDRAAALARATSAAASANTPRQPLTLLAAHRALGMLMDERGETAEADYHLSTALALADACAAPYERALTLLAWAELRHSRARGETASTLLAEAGGICAALGAAPTLARISALARRVPGGRAALARATHAGRLTEREQEVAARVVAGQSNRAIAAQLCIGERTVESHISNILAKLDFASRAQIAAWAVEHLPHHTLATPPG